MRRRSVWAPLFVVLAACSPDAPAPESTETTEGPATPVEPPVEPAEPVQLATHDIATDLDTVWAIAFTPDGSLHFTERSGRLTRMDPTAEGTQFRRVDSLQVDGVVETGEAGLMGLAIDEAGRRFVMYTAERENRIVRLDDGGSQTVLVDGIVAGTNHDGGRLIFGPDDMLYATTGDAGNAERARREGLNGKVLRIDPNSGEHEVFTTGHRNPQGLCFSPSGKLFSTEHGPTGGDEVNALEEGADYGWPDSSGTGIVNYTPAVAPAGCAVYDDDLIPQWKGDLLFATLRGSALYRLDLAPESEAVLGQEQLFAGGYGRLRDVVVGPDGALYLATSNRDGRGDPRPGDDRIVRIGPEDT
ncbi:MAG: PQQ-dependent sugar dehydrogenase [Actinobacteria bacterium]|nr:PQQ-dependent sugar dehydrogenase [Actinomycetota bacterium]